MNLWAIILCIAVTFFLPSIESGSITLGYTQLDSFRSRRDVSHLNLEYLPPTEVEQTTLSVPEPVREYLPPYEDEVAQAKEEKPNNEYLPPVEETDTVVVEEPQPSPPEEPTTQDSAVLKEDGYHYRQPLIVPDLSPAPEVEREYLPPLENEVKDTEPPQGDDKVLSNDTYQYRAIKRLRH